MMPPKHEPGESGLRERLIQAGMAILMAGKPLTLRGAAARAGVSHAAPAHHFSGLAGLETAIVARAFTLFATGMRAQAEAAGDDPTRRLLAMGRRYCDFAYDHGPLFQLMFVSGTVDHRDPELAEAQADAYAVLCEACAPFIGPGDDPALIHTSVWSITHGYALLQFDRPDCGKTAPEAAAPLETVLRHLLRLKD